jgi:hypothetical protein
MRRRNNVIPLQPPKLLTFDERHWRPATGDAAWRQWSEARFRYLLEHREQTLGGMDVLDVLYEAYCPRDAPPRKKRR